MMHRMPGSSLRSPFRMLQSSSHIISLVKRKQPAPFLCANAASTGSSPMHGSVQAYRHPTQTFEQTLSLPVMRERFTRTQNMIYMQAPFVGTHAGTQGGRTTSKQSVMAARGALRTLCDIVRHTYLSQDVGSAVLRERDS